MSAGLSSSDESGPVAVPYTTTTFPATLGVPISSNSSLLNSFSPLHPHESCLSAGLSDPSTLLSSDGESSSGASFDYFSPGPFPGSYVSPSPSSPFFQPGQEESHQQKEKYSAVLASVLEACLQGLSQGVLPRGNGEGGFRADGSFSEGLVFFECM